MDLLRKHDKNKIADMLDSICDYNKVIVNAENMEDLKAFVDGYELSKKRFIFRCSASLVKWSEEVSSMPVGQSVKLTVDDQTYLIEVGENYTKTLYDQVGWTEEVLTFLRYNANKALMNLGQDPLFPDTANDVNPSVMNGISTGTSNHDFFSQIGNGYLLGSVEAMQDDDYNYGLD